MFDITSDKVYVKTFGGFDLYYQGELIYFSSSKAKELLAVLVDWRGKAVTLSHLASILSEGERDEAAAKTAEEACKKRVESQIESYQTYGPDQVPRLEEAVISRRENTVLLAVGNPDRLPQALKDLALG